MKSHNKYDVIVIGGGIGGLVCGCYLAKAGMKVLITEQHSQPGGYCTSFTRNGFTFDVGVHYLGSCSNGRALHKIFNELDVYNHIKFARINPSDIIIISDLEVPIKNDYHETAELLARSFPEETDSIFRFFQLITEKNFLKVYHDVHKLTFKQVLDRRFKNKKIKSFFQALLGNVGLSSEDVAAVTAMIMYRQFVFDGGYYPYGSMQKIPDILVSEFKRNGGTIFLSSKVTSLNVKNCTISNIIINNEDLIYADYIVSNASQRSIFGMISDNKYISNNFFQRLRQLKPSISAFIVYLGVKSIDWKYRSSIWYFNTENVDDIYKKVYRDIFDLRDEYVICTFPSFHDHNLAPDGYDSISLIMAAPNSSLSGNLNWDQNKDMVAEKLISRVKKRIFPTLNEIKVKVVATPYSLERYTANSGGALYGWASVPSQIDRATMPYHTVFENLFQVGHWTTPGFGQGGIIQAAHSGRVVARLIMQKSHNVNVRTKIKDVI